MRTLTIVSLVFLSAACGGETLAPGPDDLPGPSDPGDGDEPGDEPSAGCEGKAIPASDEVWTIVSGDLEREFRVHVPESYDPEVPMPVVLNFHGFTSNAFQQQFLSGLNDKADEAGFIAVHPEGTGLAQSWNAGACCGDALSQEVDDVGFVNDMLDDLEARLCVDTRRIYSTGLSNGAFLSHRLGCQLSERITAIAPVAGVLGLDPSKCSPTRPVPVMHFHGTWDTLVPIDGNELEGFPSMDATLEYWAGANGCSSNTSEVFAHGDSTCQTFEGCPSSGVVTYCVIDQGGHTWPGGIPIPALGKTTTDLSATDAMWDFFTRFTL